MTPRRRGLRAEADAKPRRVRNESNARGSGTETLLCRSPSVHRARHRGPGPITREFLLFSAGNASRSTYANPQRVQPRTTRSEETLESCPFPIVGNRFRCDRKLVKLKERSKEMYTYAKRNALFPRVSVTPSGNLRLNGV